MKTKLIATLSAALTLTACQPAPTPESMPEPESAAEQTSPVSATAPIAAEDVRNKEASEKPMPAMEKVEPAVMQTTIPANQSKYLDYSPELVAGLAGQPHALFFHASWCPSCRSLDSDIAESLADLGGTVVKVDYDSSVDLRKKYSVTSQHTLVFFDANGAVASTKLGGNLKDIRSFFAN